MVDDFTLENGATSLLPYSQLNLKWPDVDEYSKNSIQITGMSLIITGLKGYLKIGFRLLELFPTSDNTYRLQVS